LPINENSCASNGLIASVGFLFLLGRLLYRNRLCHERPNLRDGLSMLTISGVLLATLGGLGTLVSLLGFSWIRAYNRISVYLGFLGLLAVATLWQRFASKFGTTVARRVWISVAAVFVVALGIADQTSRRIVPHYSGLLRAYEQDEEFFGRVESACPHGGMIFQLPYIPFPESPPPGRMAVYDHFRAYLHSKHLRWSYGAMKGRDADNWQRDVANLAPAEFVQVLACAGYCGIYVNRNGYADQAAEWEDALTEILGTAPLVSADQTLLFFPLTPYAEELRRGFTEDDWQMKKEKILYPVKARFLNGFSSPETQGTDTFRWCSPSAIVILENELPYSRQIRLELDGRIFGDRPASLRLGGPVAAGEYCISSDSRPIVWNGTLPPGRHELRFQCDGRKLKTRFAPFEIALQVFNFSLKESE
jgi:phosphoglycerol transferase